MSDKIKTAAENLVISKGEYKATSYDLMGQRGLLKIGINSLNQREQARQNFLGFLPH